jgi:hypothetical protein
MSALYLLLCDALESRIVGAEYATLTAGQSGKRGIDAK